LKRSAASSLQLAREEAESEEEEDATSPKRKKRPSQVREEQRIKRTRQTTILETHVVLERPIGDVLQVPGPSCPGVKTLLVAK
jgi:hypothetical protein